MVALVNRSSMSSSRFRLGLGLGLAVASLSLAGPVACGDDEGGTDTDGAGDTGADAGDGGGPTQDVTLSFTAEVDGAAAACGQSYDGIGAAGTTVELQDLRFYISAIQLIDEDGGAVDVTLEQNDWQHEGVALLDFEDGTGLCADGGNAETRDVVTGTVPEGEYTAVRFELAVPFELNHLDTTTAPSPLNVPSMFWNWQGGHKFLRVDFNNGAAMDAGWFVHLGSTGCTSAGATAPPDAPCAKPNAAIIELDGFDPDASTVVFDAAALVAGADLTANEPMTPPGCMSNPADTNECPAVFENLGMSFDSGTCMGGCADQAVFSVR